MSQFPQLHSTITMQEDKINQMEAERADYAKLADQNQTLIYQTEEMRLAHKETFEENQLLS
jgi:hypothetical protein